MRHGLKWLFALTILLSTASLVYYLRVAVEGVVMVELISITTRPTRERTVKPTSQPTSQPTPQPTLAPLETYTNKVRQANEYMRCVTSPNSSWVPREHGLVLPDWQNWASSAVCPRIRQPFTVTSTNRTGLFYTWRPPKTASCSDLETFTRARFCQVLNGRMLYLMGDSVMAEFYANIRYLFGLHIRFKPERDTYNRVQLSCPAPFPDIVLDFNLAYRLASTVRNTTGVDNSTVFVANKGAHFVQTSTLLRDVRGALNSLRKNYSDATIVWRTTAAGLDFKTYPGELPFLSTRPFTAPPPPIDLSTIVNRHAGYFNKSYSWHLFQEQNEAVKAMLDAKFPAVLQMDIHHLDSLRLDERRDAMHFCIPSARMEWVALLMNLLIQVAK